MNRRLIAFCFRAALATAFVPTLAASARAEGTPSQMKMREAARKFFETGKLLHDRGRFKEAAAEFERAYGEEPLAAFLYNAAQSYDEAGDHARAIAGYKKYLGFKESAAEAEQIKARLDVLEKETAAATAAAAAAAAPAPPRHTALPYKEPNTGHVFSTFLTYDNKEFVLVGVGTRKVIGFKVYAMAMYIEDEAARKGFPKLAGEAGGADQKTLLASNLVPSFIIQGDFAKHAVLWFARGVTAAKQRESYSEALADDLSPKASPEVRKCAADFVALFDKDVKEGDEIVIHTEPDGQVGVKIGSAPMKMTSMKSLRVVHQIWDIWLGAKPINENLKAELMDRIETLGR